MTGRTFFAALTCVLWSNNDGRNAGYGTVVDEARINAYAET